MKELNLLSVRNGAMGKKTLIIVYYGGHGAIVNAQLHAIVNSFEKSAATFALEKYLRMIHANAGTYVLGFMDCCREALTFDTSYGSGAAGAQADGCMCLIFACKPGGSARADSTLLKEVFEVWYEEADFQTGKVLVPDVFTNWDPDGGETTKSGR